MTRAPFTYHQIMKKEHMFLGSSHIKHLFLEAKNPSRPFKAFYLNSKVKKNKHGRVSQQLDPDVMDGVWVPAVVDQAPNIHLKHFPPTGFMFNLQLPDIFALNTQLAFI